MPDKGKGGERQRFLLDEVYHKLGDANPEPCPTHDKLSFRLPSIMFSAREGQENENEKHPMV